jgi:hypothetical protein
VATPVYPWYAMPLLVLAVLASRWEWLAVWAAAYVAFVFDHLIAVQAAAYGLSLIIVVLVAGCRRATRDPHPATGLIADRPAVSSSRKRFLRTIGAD